METCPFGGLKLRVFEQKSRTVMILRGRICWKPTWNPSFEQKSRTVMILRGRICWKPTWNPSKMKVWKMMFLFKRMIFRFPVVFLLGGVASLKLTVYTSKDRPQNWTSNFRNFALSQQEFPCSSFCLMATFI